MIGAALSLLFLFGAVLNLLYVLVSAPQVGLIVTPNSTDVEALSVSAIDGVSLLSFADHIDDRATHDLAFALARIHGPSRNRPSVSQSNFTKAVWRSVRQADSNPWKVEQIVKGLAGFSSLERALIVSAAVAIILLFVQFASSVISPILLAAFLASVATPPLHWMRAKGVPKYLALGIIIFVLFDIGSLLALVFTGALEALQDRIPTYQERLTVLSTELAANA